MARAQGGRGWQLRASHDLARALAEAGRREEALDVLAPIHDGFTEGFDTPDLVESGALLESLSGVPRPR